PGIKRKCSILPLKDREMGSGFAISADLDVAVREAIRGIEEWAPYRGDREIGETVHTMNKTKEAFRLIVLRWPKEQPDLFDQDPYFYNALATDGDDTAEAEVLFYNQRGEIENWIKELKEGFGMDWMPCGETHANAVYFRLGVIAYNLFMAMKALSLPNGWRHHRIGTVRWRLYEMAGHVFWESSRVRLALATTIDKLRILLQAGRKVRALVVT
ncbi:MAG: transposase, partial [Dehalococcoidia bacterium]|nr:transposase [Dehalococcoidia bacterium]